jgi:hypothetical protein
MRNNRSDYPDFKITHMRVISSQNKSKQHVETMYIVYEYGYSKTLEGF